jgi:uncharacterized protein Veg
MDVGQLVRVWTDVGERKPVPLLAKITEKIGSIFVINYLQSPGMMAFGGTKMMSMRLTMHLLPRR